MDTDYATAIYALELPEVDWGAVNEWIIANSPIISTALAVVMVLAIAIYVIRHRKTSSEGRGEDMAEARWKEEQFMADGVVDLLIDGMEKGILNPNRANCWQKRLAHNLKLPDLVCRALNARVKKTVKARINSAAKRLKKAARKGLVAGEVIIPGPTPLKEIKPNNLKPVNKSALDMLSEQMAKA